MGMRCWLLVVSGVKLTEYGRFREVISGFQVSGSRSDLSEVTSATLNSALFPLKISKWFLQPCKLAEEVAEGPGVYHAKFELVP